MELGPTVDGQQLLANPPLQRAIETGLVEGEPNVARPGGIADVELRQHRLDACHVDVVHLKRFGDVGALGQLQPLATARMRVDEPAQFVEFIVDAPQALGVIVVLSALQPSALALSYKSQIKIMFICNAGRLIPVRIEQHRRAILV